MLRVRIADWLFHRQFGSAGGCTCCDMRNINRGHLHSVYLAMQPQDTLDSTRVLAVTRFRSLLMWLKSNRWCFSRYDHCQIVVGFPLDLKASNHQIFKGWIAAPNLQLVDEDGHPSQLSDLGGGFAEMDGWPRQFFGNEFDISDCYDQPRLNDPSN